jgi:serine beta-lactamase-like protein LACTB
VRAHRALARQGLGLLIHDAYRPWYVTKMFWDATPDSSHVFVADPSQGSRHNRGCAVDLTVYDLATGKSIEMVSGYDEFSGRAYPDYPGGTSRQRYNRELLRRAMEAEGFRVYDAEWWHFDYQDWRLYPIGNQTFEQIRSTP